ncbi:phage holin family protein [Aestuariivirga sp.]|uniref:phage holin family protein n=1 Tax=Aestuariivirga sp. TaxID=2650926 RepID=UPI00391986B2
MLKQREETREVDRADIGALLQRLAADGRNWAEAEVTLARTELGELKAQAIRAVAFAMLGFAAGFCFLVVLSQAGIAFLAPLVGNTGVAALIVSAVLLALVGACFMVLRSAIAWRTESIFFRWFARRSSDAGP